MSGAGSKLSPREAEWLACLKQAQRREITQREAATVMGVSARWVRKLLQRMKTEGDRVVVHGLRGKPSNRRIKDDLRARVIGYLKSEYRDLGPTLAAAYLAEQKGITISKETIRQWMIHERLWNARNGNHRLAVSSWSPRRAHAGELVHWYSAEGQWLPDFPEVRCLLLMIGDATSSAVARLSAVESVEEDIALLQDYFRQFGRPGEFRSGAVRVAADSHAVIPVEKATVPPLAIRRILKHLEIAWSSPALTYPSGRVEHFLGVTARWLPARLSRAGVRTAAEANHYLASVWLPNWNKRFAVAPSAGVDLHRPIEVESMRTVIDGL